MLMRALFSAFACVQVLHHVCHREVCFIKQYLYRKQSIQIILTAYQAMDRMHAENGFLEVE